ncbi:signal peptidase II [Oscillibacter sp.]|uniref:signal peptidase II n=1 Tax=Oscillibacter sp. TaxID=1945593 RepID=UPI0026110173|nr:signal peptidase II [Oscillibacter sp.]MDD3347251.1 signal peptidase II [Oscillibacter sp.]
MGILLVSGAVLALCTAARWYLDRTSRGERTYAGGWVRLRTLWNEGAAFGLPLPKGGLIALSLLALSALFCLRRKSGAGTALILGGGVSNLLERLRRGRVYDYLQFPKAPRPLNRYVYNLADLFIFTGAVLLGKRRKVRGKR